MAVTGVVLFYTGLAASLLGLVSLVRPLRFLRLGPRRRAASVLALGLALPLVSALVPAPPTRSWGGLHIDRFMPEYHFNEVHSILIHAPADRIFAGLRAVTPDEVRWLRTLFWIRTLPARLTRRRLPAWEGTRPLLQPPHGSGRILLAEEPDRELLVGIVLQSHRLEGGTLARLDGPEAFLAFDRPDFAKATLNFSLGPAGPGWHRLTTETRVFAPDPSTRRRFAAYWNVIYPGSALLRRTWLAAVKRRAEGEPPRQDPIAALRYE